jgi:hypothetical protein
MSYSRTLYCDITGRETRLPLKLRGDGVGARPRLDCDTLDLGATIISSEHTYQVSKSYILTTCILIASQVFIDQFSVLFIICFIFNPRSSSFRTRAISRLCSAWLPRAPRIRLRSRLLHRTGP